MEKLAAMVVPWGVRLTSLGKENGGWSPQKRGMYCTVNILYVAPAAVGIAAWCCATQISRLFIARSMALEMQVT